MFRKLFPGAPMTYAGQSMRDFRATAPSDIAERLLSRRRTLLVLALSLSATLTGRARSSGGAGAWRIRDGWVLRDDD
jgi:hypothetical protein